MTSSDYHHSHRDSETTVRKVESSYELSASFDADWQLGWE
jgi:hypothetical protein